MTSISVDLKTKIGSLIMENKGHDYTINEIMTFMEKDQFLAELSERKNQRKRAYIFPTDEEMKIISSFF